MTGELRKGSRVKVTIPEAEVFYLSNSLKHVHVSYLDVDGDKGTANYIPVDWVEVLPDKPKVGDTVEGVEAYDALPVGTVLDGISPVARTRIGYVDLINGDSYEHGDISAPRVIKYVPGVTE